MTTRRTRRILAALAGITMLAALPSRGPAHATALHAQAGQDKTKAFDDEFEKGRQLLQRREYFEALKAFQRANQLAGGHSAACFLAMAQAMEGMNVHQNAVDAAQSAIELAGDNPRLLARAHSIRGLAFQALAEKDPAKIENAETEFRQALVADPESLVADLHYHLAVALMRQGKDDEGIAELKREIAIRPNGTTADEARMLIANPRRARETYAPEFSFVSVDGRTMSLEALRGKVVLLDFWATWCGPCVKALPSVRKVHKAHASDPFIIVGVSADRDEKAWRLFVDKNGMVWPQYWDENHQVREIFGVKVIPTYVLIDAEGIERLRVTGSGFHEARTLGAEIDKQVQRAAQAR